jgi:Proline-rich nuclear receptor coactivator motif
MLQTKTPPPTPPHIDAPPPPAAYQKASVTDNGQLQPALTTQMANSPSPKRPSSRRKSKSDYAAPGYEGTPAAPKPRRSPKSHKVNGVKNSAPQQAFSTPSKPVAIPSHQKVPSTSSVARNGSGAVEFAANHYAGPTFHSSPAPSSLPMPSFFASRENPPSRPVFQTGPYPESPPQNYSPQRSESLSHDLDNSPLAPFFRADREEKTRIRGKYISENGVFSSPTLRPASAGALRDYYHRSESPVLLGDTLHPIARPQFDLRSTLSFWLMLTTLCRSFHF